MRDPSLKLDPQGFWGPLKGMLKRAFGYQVANKGWDHNDPPPVLSDKKKKELQQATSMETARGTFRTLMDMVGMYWTKSGKHEIAIASALAATTLGMSALSVDVLVEYSEWNRQFMDIFQNVGAIVLQNKETITNELIAANPDLANDAPKLAFEVGQKLFNMPEMSEQFDDFIHKLSVEFPIVVAKYLATAITAFTSAQHLALRWRTWITGKFTNEWLKDKAFYKIKHAYSHIDNPNQRIQEDLDKLTDGVVSISTEGLESLLKLTAFSTLLYTSFGMFNPATLGGPDIDIQGYLFWSALGYAAVGTGALGAIAHSLPKIFRNKQVAEGIYRAGLMSVEQNAEQIALNNGEDREKEVLKAQFNDVVNISKQYINKRKQMMVFNSVHANLGSIIPYIAAAPMFFTGQVTLGQISQTAYAFQQVENSFSFVMNNIQFFASMKANIDRLGTLLSGIRLAHYEKEEQSHPSTNTAPSGPAPK
ncbi:MAG: hypothetical protein H6867_07240 [Rhodospirillales bacterium]|nr:hypothetical protein [Rhodospirillales bacterium]MCB9995345.1 hypothetical protein [Rhodospirillales bacterium]